jgi:hypothetical protein
MSKGLAAPQAERAFAQLHLVACDVVRGMELRMGIRIAQSSPRGAEIRVQGRVSRPRKMRHPDGPCLTP